MDVKEAVRVAKAHVADLFAEENIANVALEEVVVLDESPSRKWNITIGFSRPWENSMVAAVVAGKQGTRSYKVVRIDDGSGAVESLTDRFLPGSG